MLHSGPTCREEGGVPRAGVAERPILRIDKGSQVSLHNFINPDAICIVNNVSNIKRK